MSITAAKLYDYILCPHRVWRDRYGPQDEKSRDTNPFLEMLWTRGVQHEADVIRQLGTFADLTAGTLEERAANTIAEMKKGTELIYQGVLQYEDLLGIPDLLKKMPDGMYIPVDIKSGLGLEGADGDEAEEGRPKKHYAVQLCLYVDILKRLGFARENKAQVIDIRGNEVDYPLDSPQGPRTPKTWWQLYEEVKAEVRALLANEQQNRPALSGTCKLCAWQDSCKQWCKDGDDLTNIFYLGRGKRDVLNKDLKIERVAECATLDVADILAHKAKSKTFLKGIGEATLSKMVNRALVLTRIKKPVVYKHIEFPKVSTELFFDIEDDPTQDFVYLHGVYQRKNGKGEFIHFLATKNTREAEKAAWQEFWEYIRSLKKGDYAVYYYSHHEETTYRKLQKQYPDVVYVQELDEFFADPNVIDLYSDVVLKYTDWPLSSYSIKELAVYSGFKWRDETPSGALSIQWYNQYLATGDKDILKRIVDYNEDDCKATMVVKDAIAELMVQK